MIYPSTRCTFFTPTNDVSKTVLEGLYRNAYALGYRNCYDDTDISDAGWRFVWYASNGAPTENDNVGVRLEKD